MLIIVCVCVGGVLGMELGKRVEWIEEFQQLQHWWAAVPAGMDIEQ